MNHGWVKLHRKSIENDWLRNHKLWAFWTYCLLKASHKNRKAMVGYQEIFLQPGQFIFGRKKAVLDTGLTERNIRTCLNLLKKSGNLSVKSTNKYSIITIINWELYQGGQTENDRQGAMQMSNQRPANGTPVTTNKKLKNDKEYQEARGEKVDAPFHLSQQKNHLNSEENSKEKERTNNKKFIKPSLEDVRNYFIECGLGTETAGIEQKKFFDRYDSNGWKVGVNPMSDWQASVRNWVRNIKIFNKSSCHLDIGKHISPNKGSEQSEHNSKEKRYLEMINEHLQEHGVNVWSQAEVLRKYLDKSTFGKVQRYLKTIEATEKGGKECQAKNFLKNLND